MSSGRNIFVDPITAGWDPKTQPPPIRQEIHTLLANPQMRNLYLLGLERMQKRPESDPRSWFQIAGIHGAPYAPWNNETDSRGRGDFGYCTHSSVLFLPWHRAYLALYEKCLWSEIQSIAAEFSDPALTRLATTFRIPYWDWAYISTLSPDITSPRVRVRRPKKTTDEEIDNPLSRYKFQTTPNRTLGSGEFASWPQTLRWPNNRTANARSQPEIYVDVLREVVEMQRTNRDWDERFPTRGKLVNIRDRLYGLLNIVQQDVGQSFKGFSSNAWERNGVSSDYGSAESVHDWLHGYLGNGGHMGSVPVAAFDPIFWLHHCNVDRIWALWQALHPEQDDKWILNETSRTAWTLNRPETETMGLLPFRRNAQTLWNSKEMKDLTLFGSTYPELTSWGKLPRPQLATEVARKVRELYYPLTAAARISSAVKSAAVEPVGLFTVNTVALAPFAIGEEDQAKSTVEAVQEKAQAVLSVATTTAQEFPSVEVPTSISTAEIPLEKVVIDSPSTPGTTHREYFANVRARKYAFHGTFSIHVFIGQFTSDWKSRVTDPNLVGTFTVFASDVDETKCEACLEGHDRGLIVTGQIPLTGALLDRIEAVGSLEKGDVTSFLQRHLHWRLHREDMDHTNIARAEVDDPEDLKFSVTSCLVDVPTEKDQLPIYRDWNPIPEITEGRPSGTGFNDTEGFEPEAEAGM